MQYFGHLFHCLPPLQATWHRVCWQCNLSTWCVHLSLGPRDQKKTHTHTLTDWGSICSSQILFTFTGDVGGPGTRTRRLGPSITWNWVGWLPSAKTCLPQIHPRLPMANGYLPRLRPRSGDIDFGLARDYWEICHDPLAACRSTIQGWRSFAACSLNCMIQPDEILKFNDHDDAKKPISDVVMKLSCKYSRCINRWNRWLDNWAKQYVHSFATKKEVSPFQNNLHPILYLSAHNHIASFQCATIAGQNLNDDRELLLILVTTRIEHQRLPQLGLNAGTTLPIRFLCKKF